MNNLLFFVGLGNPGKKYQRNRHNAGFIVLDYFVNEIYKSKSIDIKQDFKFNSLIYTFKRENTDVICVFPLTFMNLSGNAVKQVLDYYKVSDAGKNLVVIHDDMDIPLGSFKLKFDGGDGGHNGVKSIINYLGKDFGRLRVGISKPIDKNYKEYVLQDFLNEEWIRLNDILPTLSSILNNIIREGFEMTMSKIGIFIKK